jgi:uncharacterized protein
MYPRFGLTLMVNHACNLRCTYCYTGDKFLRAMPEAIVWKAIDRAIQSLQAGGTLELAFFGGEPLVEAALIEQAIKYAVDRAHLRGVEVICNMTTNGTVVGPAAWRVIAHPRMTVAISHDGLPSVHDRHRIAIDGHGSSALVENTLRRLVEEEIDFHVVTVVRPDTVSHLADGLFYLYDVGVRRFDLSLDLWTTWTRDDARHLSVAISNCATQWAKWLPHIAINWFDSRTAHLMGVPSNVSARCSFGAGEVAVAPSGNLYPCERLIGEDRPDNAMRLPGHALDGDDFLAFSPASPKHAAECSACSLQPVCSTTCRCSNYLRTGDVTRPDGLLCWLDQCCIRETAAALAKLNFVPC